MTATSEKTKTQSDIAKDIIKEEQANKVILNHIKGQGRPPPREPGASSGPVPGPPQTRVLGTVADAARGAFKGAVGAMGTLTSLIPGPVRQPYRGDDPESKIGA